MSILGIDFGTSGSVLASVRQGKLHVLRTEISERSTPALVSYTSNGERVMGDVAQGSLNSNFTRTCNNMKFLLGASADDKDFVNEQRKYTLAPISESSSKHLQYELEGRNVPIISATASFLLKLQETAKAAMGTPVLGGSVIAVPSFYGPTRVKTLEAAAQISGLQLLGTVTETMAIAMDYGIYRRKQFHETEPVTTAFVSIGHGSCTVSIVEFTKHYAKVLVDECHTDLGGRRLDMLIVELLNAKFKKSSGGLDAMSNLKARLKLETTAEKCKKTLSANKETNYGLEYLLDGEDLNGTLTKVEFELMSEPIKQEFKEFMEFCVKQLPEGRSASSVELVGNGTRVPWIVDIVEEALQTKTSRTLSADETVARGCALFSAMLSPTVKINGYPIFAMHEKVPRKLRNPPPPPKVEEKKESTGFMSGFLNKTPKTDETEATAPADGGDQTPSSVIAEDVNPEDEVAVEEEIVEESESSEAPEHIITEEPLKTPEVYSPGTVRGFEEQEKNQRRIDNKAKQQQSAINNFETFVFLCRERVRTTWKVIGSFAIGEITNKLDSLEDWLYDHMSEEFTAYEDRQEDLRQFVSQFVSDFKPTPAVVEPTPPKPEVATIPEVTEPQSDVTTDPVVEEAQGVTE